MKRIIFHIDVNSAFLSWEAVHRLYNLGGHVDLRQEVAAVGGDMAMRHGIILAKSIPAKQYHIKTGESITEALQKCPHLKLVPPNYNLYEECSAAFMDILRSFTPAVEQYSIDEAYMDMTGSDSLFGDSVSAANEIREAIKRELGFTVNIGISENKLLAKMASNFQKPDKVHTLWKKDMKYKMWPLPVSELFFVGRATKKKLTNLGIRTIGELANTDLELLKSHFKKHGETIWAFANGIDVSEVQPQSPAPKGYGNSTTIAFDVTDVFTARHILLALSETVAARLRKAGVQAEVIGVGLKTFDLRYSSHQMTLHNATDITLEIYQYACQLFDSFWDGTPLRYLGIHTGRIKDKTDMRQIDLFDTIDYKKLETLDTAIDTIRQLYGKDIIKRAPFINSPIDHMSGGISREKRTVDYNKIKID